MVSLKAQWTRYYAECEMHGVWGPRTVPAEDMDRYFKECGSTFTKGHEDGVSWCGIFATYILRQAEGDVAWRIGKPLQAGTNVSIISGNAGIDEGDVAYAGSNHYFIIIQPPSTPGGVPLAVHGNYGGAGSNHVLYRGYHDKYPLSKVVQYYRIA